VDDECNLGTFSGDEYVIDDQTSLDALTGYTAIDEVLMIDCSSDPEALTSLAGLECLTEAHHNVFIHGCPGLTDLTGLDSLQLVSGELWIQGNNNITNLIGLGSLTSVDDRLIVQGNLELESLEGLEELSHVGGTAAVEHNPNLPTCDANALFDQLDSWPEAACSWYNLEDECEPELEGCV
jgi:hypothetical protein